MSARGGQPREAARRAGGARTARIRRILVLSASALAIGLVPLVIAVAIPDHDRATAQTEQTATGTHRAANTARHHRPRGRNTAAARPTALPTATVTPASQAANPVPRSFFGLSTEYFSLPLFERDTAVFERVLSLLRVRGGGPMVLRIGGDSADRTFWAPGLTRFSRWQFEVTPDWLKRTGALVRSLGMRVILDLNLVTDSPLSAARLARVAEASLPRRSIAGFEIGNEPDLYTRRYWQRLTARSRLFSGILPIELSASRYARDFLAYSGLLTHFAPHVPLLGPVIANPTLDVNWVSRLIAGAGETLGMVTAHRYPLSACMRRTSLAYPTIERVLNERTSAGVAKSITPEIRLAHRARLPFRLTELNSVTCGGRPGVSDTFATALWAPDALFEVLRAGADGVNVHIRANTTNGPFALSARGLYARPLLYGLLLFARTLGPSSRFVPLRVSAAPSLHLNVWAVRVLGQTLHVLLIDKGSRGVNVDLNLPGTGPATVQRLTAPSVGSRSGVTLAGQWLSRGARWQGRRIAQRVALGTRGYRVAVPAYSAALVSVRLRARAPHAQRTRRAENVLRHTHPANRHRYHDLPVCSAPNANRCGSPHWRY